MGKETKKKREIKVIETVEKELGGREAAEFLLSLWDSGKMPKKEKRGNQ